MATTSVHGHEVLDLLEGSESGFTRAALLAAIERRFGPDVRFHTCSAQGLSAEILLAFFEARGKVYETGGRLRRRPDSACEH